MNSKCGSCGMAGSWEISEEEPTGSHWKYYFVRCSMCKVPIGVLEYYNSGAKIAGVEKKVKDSENSLAGMLQTINDNIRRLAILLGQK